MENKPKIILPLLITKNYVLFPSRRDERLDAGRDFTISAINTSMDKYDSVLIVVAQKDSKLNNPTKDDIYQVGTLCTITSYSDLKTYVRVRVSGTKRVKLTNIDFNNDGYFEASYEPLEDISSDQKEELSLSEEIV